MATPVMPVLMADINMLKKPVDIIKRILQWYTSVPKNINDTFNEQEISFRYDDARRGHDAEALQDQVRGNILAVLSRYFPTASTLEVSVSISRIDAVRYNVVIDIIVVIDGETHSISQDYELDSDGNLAFKLKGD